jgi:hypothetical protein
MTARVRDQAEPRGPAPLRSVESERVEVQQTAIRSLRSEAAELEQSAVLSARARRLTVRRSTAALMIGRSVVARNVTTAVLLAPAVRGNVRTIVDWRTAFAFGLGIVLGRRLLRLLRL